MNSHIKNVVSKDNALEEVTNVKHKAKIDTNINKDKNIKITNSNQLNNQKFEKYSNVNQNLSSENAKDNSNTNNL